VHQPEASVEVDHLAAVAQMAGFLPALVPEHLLLSQAVAA